MFFFIFRCVDDGYCSLEQADLIQRYVEKKLGILYKIDETIGKSLMTNDTNEGEEIKERKAMIISDDDDEDDNSHISSNRNPNSLLPESTKHISSINDDDDDDNNNVNLSPSLTTNHRLSPSPPVPSPSKGNPSPGEIITKTMSPSSLSEASPILD